MFSINKLFTSIGYSGIKTIGFYEMPPAVPKKQGVNLIYFSDFGEIKYPSQKKLESMLSKDPEEVKCGPVFLASANKRHDFQYGVIPLNFTFRSQRVNFNNYLKWFRSVDKTKLKIYRKYVTNKSELLDKSTFFDCTPIYPKYLDISSHSPVIAVKELLNVFSQIMEESKNKFYKKNNYILLDLNTYGTRHLLKELWDYSKLHKKLFNSDDFFKGIIVRVDGMYWPLTTTDNDNIVINPIVYNKIKKPKIKINDEIYEKDEKSGTLQQVKKNIKNSLNSLDSDQNTDESLEQDGINTSSNNLSNTSSNSLKYSIKKIDAKLQEIKKLDKKTLKIGSIKQEQKKLDSSEDKQISSLLDELQNEISRNVPGTTFEEKIKYLTHHSEHASSFKKYQKELEIIKELNKKYNGAIEVQESLIKKQKNYFDVLKLIGFDTFHSYNRQQTEFDEVLDETMFDLFKSLENDPEIGVKVLEVKISFEDNYKSRYKIYTVKIKNTKFGYKKPYEIKLQVPYPEKGKYLKIDNVNYIMSNQFFPKPIIKVDPETVRIYTHFSTAAIQLKGTTLSTNSDYHRFKTEFLKILAELKIKNTHKQLPSENIQQIKEEFNLPSNINTDLIMNLHIK